MKCIATFAVLILASLLVPSLLAQPNSADNPAGPSASGQTLSGQTLAGQTIAGQTTAGQTIVVIPFDNQSPTPGLEWLGESFSEALHERLNSPVLYLASRSERLRAYDRQGLPAGVHPSRATLYRLAEQMDVDYAVLGSYKYDGTLLTATAELLDMRGLKLLPSVHESAPLADLGTLQSALAWDLLHQIRSDYSVPKEKYIAGAAPLRLDALENYVRGIISTSADEKVQHFREAVRVNPDYAEAWLQLGETYYAQHNYEAAMAALAQLQSAAASGAVTSGAEAREGNFYLGLAAFAHGDFAKSESAFEYVAARVPLAEVYNNLGIVAARRGQKQSTEYFERAILNDPSDPDYHFNLAVTLAQTGERAEAVRELRAALDRRPNDADAKTLLDSLNPPAGSIVMSAATAKVSQERIKRNYEEDAFRQMTTQMANWAEQRFARADPTSHSRYHIELGKELEAHGFTAEAESEFEHAAAVDPSSPAALAALAEDYDERGDAEKARAQAEASLRIRESAEAYLLLARLDLRAGRTEAASQNINLALQLEPGNILGQDLKRTLAAKLAEKAQPLPQP